MQVINKEAQLTNKETKLTLLYQCFSSLLTFGICTVIVSFGLVLDWANTKYFLNTNDGYSSLE